jgi:hypothetical protein
MAESDRTYISSVIAALYVGASLHCLWRTVVISREGDAERRTAHMVASGEVDFAADCASPPRNANWRQVGACGRSPFRRLAATSRATGKPVLWRHWASNQVAEADEPLIRTLD